MRILLVALALAATSQAAADSPTMKSQILIEMTIITPDDHDRLAGLDRDLEHVILNGVPVRMTRTSQVSGFNLVDPRPQDRIHLAPSVTFNDGESAVIRVGDRDDSSYFKVEASIVKGNVVNLNIDQNFMRFGCVDSVPCSSKIKLALVDERTAVIDGNMTDTNGTHSYQMLVTPHIVRSRADMERINQQKAKKRGTMLREAQK